MHARTRGNRGSALLIAVLLVIVTAGLAGAYLAVSGIQAARVMEGADMGRARCAAEAGIDHMRVHLLSLVDPEAEDPALAWDGVLQTNDGTPAWAVEVPTAEGSYTVRVLDNVDGDGDLLDESDGIVVLEATGYGAPDGASIVVRATVTLEKNDPTDNFAILTGGDLDIYGDETVDGTLGSVHTNEDLTLQGSAGVSRDATASGSATVTGDGVEVGGALQADRFPIPIEPVVPAEYRPDATFILTSDGRVLDGPTGVALYDFGTSPGPDRGPGIGAVGVAMPYNGLLWTTRGGWTTTTSGWVDGLYYVEGDIRFQHGGTSSDPWKVTLVAEGDISMEGNPYLEPYFNETELFVAGGDVYARGTGANAVLEGLILAHEQIDLDGNILFSGRMVAESAENSPGSAVDDGANPLLSSFGGNVVVTYNGGLSRSLTTEYRLPIRSWEEGMTSNEGLQTLGNQGENMVEGGEMANLGS